MTIYASLLPPSNRPIHDHSQDDNFSFAYAVQLERRSLSDKITDHPPSAASFSAGPRDVLDRPPDPSSPSWAAVAKLISYVKEFHDLSLEDDTIQWCPKPIVRNPEWTPLDNEEDLIRHVLDAARETVTCLPEGKKPSSLCVKIKKVVTISESELKSMVAARNKKDIEDDMFGSIVAAMKPFNVNNRMYVNFKGVLSEDVWRRLLEVMHWNELLDKEGSDSLFVRVRKWQLKERVLESVESNKEEEECCSGQSYFLL